MGRKTVATIIGTRPNFIKYAALKLDPDRVNEILIHTGQHYSHTLSEDIWSGLKLREPDHVLNCGHDKPAFQFQCMIRELTLILESRKPDFVIVIGDCNTTLGGALAANFLKIPVIHIEAGCRSFDMDMPEERNRKLTDHLALVNLCISQKHKLQILTERCLPGQHQVHVVGDILYDVMLATLHNVRAHTGDFYLATVHREENANHHQEEILEGLDELNKKVIFPKHPRLELTREYDNIVFTAPLSYEQMLTLIVGAEMIFTDSGGIQREAVWLGRPCVLLRENTEIPEFVKSGHVIMVGHSKPKILAAQYRKWPDEPFEHGQDGQAAKRIAAIIYGL